MYPVVAGMHPTWYNCWGMQGSSGVHEDEVMGVGLDASLAAEEAAEQAVLTQLRNRAACLENDLLRQALDGLAPNSKA